MTVAEKHWSHEQDKRFREQFATHDAANYWRHLDNKSDQDLKADIANIVIPAEREREELNAMEKDVTAKIDAAVAEHASLEEPAAEELENPATPTARKVFLRGAILDSKAKLEATIDPLRKTLKAVQAQSATVRAKASGRLFIETEWHRRSPEIVWERLVVLGQVKDMLDEHKGLLFGLKKEVQKARAALEHARETEGNRDVNGRAVTPLTVNSLRMGEPQRHAARMSAKLEIFRTWLRQVTDEIDEIRATRIAQLYA